MSRFSGLGKMSKDEGPRNYTPEELEFQNLSRIYTSCAMCTGFLEHGSGHQFARLSDKIRLNKRAVKKRRGEREAPFQF
jgi:hypothetical protein